MPPWRSDRRPKRRAWARGDVGTRHADALAAMVAFPWRRSGHPPVPFDVPADFPGFDLALIEPPDGVADAGDHPERLADLVTEDGEVLGVAADLGVGMLPQRSYPPGVFSGSQAPVLRTVTARRPSDTRRSSHYPARRSPDTDRARDLTPIAPHFC